MPGQLGPISLILLSLPMLSLTLSISSTGIPSVIQAISLIPASAASTMASAANGGGTKIIDASAPVAATPFATVSKIGFSK